MKENETRTIFLQMNNVPSQKQSSVPFVFTMFLSSILLTDYLVFIYCNFRNVFVSSEYQTFAIPN